MEQSLNIFTTFVQVVQSSKGNADTLQTPLQKADPPIKFDDLVLDASQAKLLWVQDNEVGDTLISTDNLEQQILELSVGLEGQLGIAAQENAKPEAVDEILMGAVSQLWALLDEFDTQNGTQLVSDLSKSLLQMGPEANKNSPAQAVAPQVTKAVNSGVPPVSFAGQLFNQATTTTFSTSTPIVQGEMSASSAIVQSGESRLAIVPLVPFSQPGIQGPGMPYFPQAPSLLNGNEPVANNALAQISGVASGSLIPAVNSETTPILQVTKDLPPVQLNQNPDPKLASNGDAQVDGVKKSGSLILSIVAGINVGAKFKELLLVSAQNIASGKEALTSFGENGGGFNGSKTELSNPLMPVRSEQPPPPSGFSKNIANQIQKVTLNMGRTQIELAPRGLGSIIIELQAKDSGGLQVVLRAESPAVLNAMRNDRDVLLAVLSNDDVQPEEISLDFESFGQNKFGRSEKEGELLDSITEQNESEDELILIPDRPTGLGHLDIIT